MKTNSGRPSDSEGGGNSPLVLVSAAQRSGEEKQGNQSCCWRPTRHKALSQIPACWLVERWADTGPAKGLIMSDWNLDCVSNLWLMIITTIGFGPRLTKRYKRRSVQSENSPCLAFCSFSVDIKAPRTLIFSSFRHNYGEVHHTDYRHACMSLRPSKWLMPKSLQEECRDTRCMLGVTGITSPLSQESISISSSSISDQ